MRDRFDDEIRRRLFDYSEEPSGDLWSRIVPLAPASTSGRKSGFSKVTMGSVGLFMVVGLYTGSNTEMAESNFSTEITLATLMPKNEMSTSLTTFLTMDRFSNDQFELFPAQKLNNGNSDNERKNNYGIKTKRQSINYSVNSSQLTENRDEDLKDNFLNSDDPSGVKMLSDQSLEVKQGKDNSAYKSNYQAKRSTPRELVQRKKINSHDKFNIYLTAMPTFGYQRVESNRTDNIIIESIKHIPAISLNRLGVRAELGAEWPLTKKVKMFSGLMYYQRKQTIDYVLRIVDSTVVNAGPDGSIIVQAEYGYQDKTFEYELKNLGLQLGFNLLLSKKKFMQTLGTSLEFQVALNKINLAAKEEGFTTNPSAYVFYNLYYRLQYPAQGRLKAVIQPTLNYSFYINQNLNAPFYVKPYGLGLNIGCTYNF